MKFFYLFFICLWPVFLSAQSVTLEQERQWMMVTEEDTTYHWSQAGCLSSAIDYRAQTGNQHDARCISGAESILVSHVDLNYIDEIIEIIEITDTLYIEVTDTVFVELPQDTVFVEVEVPVPGDTVFVEVPIDTVFVEIEVPADTVYVDRSEFDLLGTVNWEHRIEDGVQSVVIEAEAHGVFNDYMYWCGNDPFWFDSDGEQYHEYELGRTQVRTRSQDAFPVTDTLYTDCRQDLSFTIYSYDNGYRHGYLGQIPLSTLAPQPEGGFFTDFSQYTTGEFPHDWTLIWDPDEGTDITVEEVSEATGGKVLRFTGGQGTSNRHAVIWDMIDETVEGRHEAEVLIRARVANFSPAGSSHLAALARVSGTADLRTGYSVRPRSFSAGTLDAVEFLNGTSHTSSQSTAVNANWINNTWMYLGLKLSDNNTAIVEIRQWIDGTNEPQWTVQDVGSFPVPDGGIGVSAIGHGVVEIDWIGIGVDGNEAPRGFE